MRLAAASLITFVRSFEIPTYILLLNGFFLAFQSIALSQRTALSTTNQTAAAVIHDEYMHKIRWLVGAELMLGILALPAIFGAVSVY